MPKMFNPPLGVYDRPRKVHYFYDQKGAKLPHSGKPFGNTLCKINSNSPEMLTTDDPNKVTCKLCRQHSAFKVILNAQFGKLGEFNYEYVTPREQAEARAKFIPERTWKILDTPTYNGLRTRYRKTWRGKLILQIETSYNNADPRDPLDMGQTFMRWRDATLADLDVGVV